MPFRQLNLDRSFNSPRPAFDKYVYKTDDLKAEVQSGGYFSAARFVSDPDWQGSVIECDCPDGFIIGTISQTNGVNVLFDSASSGATGMPVSPDDGNFYVAEGTNWVNAIGTSNAETWQWDTDTGTSAPSTGNLKADNSDLTQATELRINVTSFSALNISEVLRRIGRGDQIVLRQFGANANNVDLRVTDFATDSGSFFVIPVEYKSGPGAYLDGAFITLQLFELGDRKADISLIDLDTFAVAEETPNSPTVIGLASQGAGWQTVGTPNGIAVDTSLGALQNVKGRTIDVATGTISLQYQQTGGGNGNFYLASQRSTDGVTWTYLPNSLRNFRNGSNTESFLQSTSGISNWLDGEYLRFVCYTDNNRGELYTPDAVFEGNAIQGFSVAWSITEQ